MKLATYLHAYRRRVEKYRLDLLAIEGFLSPKVFPLKPGGKLRDIAASERARFKRLEDVILKRAEPNTVPELHRRIRELSGQIRQVQRECKHIPDQGGDGELAGCDICGKYLGWHCDKSPTKICEYDYKNHGEQCIHCGEPEERK